MEDKFNATIDRIDNFAGKTGNWLNSKITKILMVIFFTISLTFFGFLVFSTKFIKTLFGIKN